MIQESQFVKKSNKYQLKESYDRLSGKITKKSFFYWTPCSLISIASLSTSLLNETHIVIGFL